MKLLLLHILFLFIALLITFGLVPIDRLYFNDVPSEEIKQYYQDAFAFNSNEAWQILVTWFLGLSCGRLILRALNSKGLDKKGSQTTKSIKSE